MQVNSDVERPLHSAPIGRLGLRHPVPRFGCRRGCLSGVDDLDRWPSAHVLHGRETTIALTYPQLPTSANIRFDPGRLSTTTNTSVTFRRKPGSQ